jgi:hypothetical protein
MEAMRTPAADFAAFGVDFAAFGVDFAAFGEDFAALGEDFAALPVDFLVDAVAFFIVRFVAAIRASTFLRAVARRVLHSAHRAEGPHSNSSR